MKTLAAIALWLVGSGSFADALSYSGVVRVWAESDTSIALHFHDWSSRPQINDPEKPDAAFSMANRSAYVELWSKTNGTRLWHVPSPAFSYLWVSPDGKYIVGMSDIKLRNPYQLVVCDNAGAIRLRKHIAPEKAAFTTSELATFWARFPVAKRHLSGRVEAINELLYVDFLVFGIPNLLPEGAWEALYQKTVPNPEFPDVGESVSNYVYWFSDTPDPRIVESDGTTHLTFWSRSNTGPSKRVSIEIPNQGLQHTGDPRTVRHSTEP